MMDEIEEFENKLGYVFRDRRLLLTALTHSSYANENKKSGIDCNERLEFLGDAVLGYTVADYLYRAEPVMPEGQMTRLRAELVCEKSLEGAASWLGLGRYLCLGKGEEASGGRRRPSILADATEAVVAAVYIDGGNDAARKLILDVILPTLLEGATCGYDYKTALQELVQRKSGQILSYHLTGESGPDHSKRFDIEVCLNGDVKGSGSGKNKKEAEQAAAKAALEEMQK